MIATDLEKLERNSLKQTMSDIESNPGPNGKTAHVKKAKKHVSIGTEVRRSVLYLNARTLNKLKMDDLRKIVETKKPSCILINETGGLTGLLKDRNSTIPGYSSFPNDRSIDKQGGGTVIWVQNTIESTEANMDSTIYENLGAATVDELQGERQWRCLRLGRKDIAVCVFYGGVQDGETKFTRDGNSLKLSNKEWNTALYTLLGREIEVFKTQGYEVLVLGDTNGHLGKHLNPKCAHELNSNGELYVNHVEENELVNLNIAKNRNGRSNASREDGLGGRNLCSGRWTYMEGCKRSIVDYAACSQDFVEMNMGMRIYDKGELSFVSDHCPIMVWWHNKTDSLSKNVKEEVSPSVAWSTTNAERNEKFSVFVEKEMSIEMSDSWSVDEHMETIENTLQHGADLYLKIDKKKQCKKQVYPKEIVEKLENARKTRREWALALSRANSKEDMDKAAAINTKYKLLRGVAKRSHRRYMVNWRKVYGATSFSTNQSKVRKFWKTLSGRKQDNAIRNLTSPVDNKLYSNKEGLINDKGICINV